MAQQRLNVGEAVVGMQVVVAVTCHPTLVGKAGTITEVQEGGSQCLVQIGNRVWTCATTNLRGHVNAKCKAEGRALVDARVRVQQAMDAMRGSITGMGHAADHANRACKLLEQAMAELNAAASSTDTHDAGADDQLTRVEGVVL